MGLDISLIKNIKFIASDDSSLYTDDEFDDLHDNYIQLRNEYFEEQSDGLISGFYDGERVGVDDIDRLAWSYSSYGNWRQHLIQFSGFDNINELGINIEKLHRNNKICDVINETEEYNRIPFSEMTFFSDCEGFIGPKTSLRLYEDFKSNKKKFRDYTKKKYTGDVSAIQYYTDKYDILIKYYKIASVNNGVLLFH